MKYKVQIIDNLVFHPSDATYNEVNKASAFPGLIMLLEQGYEIYQAIPLASGGSGIIEYVLRKEIDE